MERDPYGALLRNFRERGHYTTANELIDRGIAAIIKPPALAVYNVLCRKANINTSITPPLSYAAIGVYAGMTKKSAIKSVRMLTACCLVSFESTGNSKENRYYILDKSAWKYPENWEEPKEKKRRKDKDSSIGVNNTPTEGAKQKPIGVNNTPKGCKFYTDVGVNNTPMGVNNTPIENLGTPVQQGNSGNGKRRNSFSNYKETKETTKTQNNKNQKTVFNEEEFVRAYTWATFLGTEEMGLLYDLYDHYPKEVKKVIQNIRKVPKAKELLVKLYRESVSGGGTPS